MNEKQIQKVTELVKIDINKDIVSHLMNRFDDEIVVLEDENDPMKPSLFREEFKTFLGESIENSVRIERTGERSFKVNFGIGDTKVLGLEEELDVETTDGLRIIGTILNGIVGEYVLVTVEMARRMFPGRRNYDLGRTGRAYLMKREEYDEGIALRGWEPEPTWRFSNFPGISDYFDVDLDMEKYIPKLIEAYK